MFYLSYTSTKGGNFIFPHKSHLESKSTTSILIIAERVLLWKLEVLRGKAFPLLDFQLCLEIIVS